MSTQVLLNGRPVVAPDVDPLAAVRYANEAVAMMRATDAGLSEADVLRLATTATAESAVEHLQSGSLDSARLAAAATVILKERLAEARLAHMREWGASIGRLRELVDMPACRCSERDACEKCATKAGAR